MLIFIIHSWTKKSPPTGSVDLVEFFSEMTLGQNLIYCPTPWHMPLTGEPWKYFGSLDITVTLDLVSNPWKIRILLFPGVQLPELMDYLLTSGNGPLWRRLRVQGKPRGFLITAIEYHILKSQVPLKFWLWHRFTEAENSKFSEVLHLLILDTDPDFSMVSFLAMRDTDLTDKDVPRLSYFALSWWLIALNNDFLLWCMSGSQKQPLSCTILVTAIFALLPKCQKYCKNWHIPF